MLPTICIGDEYIVHVNNKSYSFTKSHPSILGIRNAINSGDEAVLESLLSQDYSYAIEDIVKEENIQGVTIENGEVYYNGEVLHNEIARRMVQMKQEGFDMTSYINFLNKLMQNPSYNSRQQLYLFLEDHKLPITEDGNILAYKGVRDDYTDVHTGTFNNSVGNTHEMPRENVDDNTNNGCSAGFHAGSEKYATGFGTKTVIVSINPKDCVSVPHRETSKLRCCKYTVVAEYTRTLDKACYTEDAKDAEHEYFIDDVEALIPGDKIRFTYNNTDRHVVVKEIDDEFVVGQLLLDDPSYDFYSPQVRRFRICNMEDVCSE